MLLDGNKSDPEPVQEPAEGSCRGDIGAVICTSAGRGRRSTYTVRAEAHAQELGRGRKVSLVFGRFAVRSAASENEKQEKETESEKTWRL